ncbi:4-hydroxy-tetrahydrodipicolinate reductase [Salinisphaera sp. Q1T1-3]|uniref:4-hydroxy-tetrahydrodipicolinate reductase n=1 Tax=Salinisphaera sp. Q1T1-3 TaxID=2321229 RepID=UPI000E70D8DB|nr:4-hydroxy-tetrahydrodipicolinate reductase [Salinisphaera sp. Q1T1-3]RJS92732.1 4-hydroxy-tetrahydrodipicolinate reductase [Salinisphaera sp. Q1T1-3]
MTTRVAINGASGRMGRELIKACAQRDDLVLAAAFGSPDSDQLGLDAGRLAGIAECGVALAGSQTMPDSDFDVLVDFSLPGPSIAALAICLEKQAALVIGTTGYSDAQQAEIDAASARIAIVQAPNYSAGVNLTLDLVARAAAALGPDTDIEIIEAHHRHKVDAPSGTALKLGDVAARATGRDLRDCAVYTREGQTGERPDGAIGFATVRGGDIVGEHTVLFAGQGERVEVTHRATSRQTFAGGAMRAAVWAAARKPGAYDMNDVLGLSER